jgi:hypothetical protein
LRELYYLRNHCAFLDQEAEKWRVTVLQREEELGRLDQQLQMAERTLSE